MKDNVIRMIRLFGGMTMLTRQTIREMFRPPYYLGLLADQSFFKLEFAQVHSFSSLLPHRNGYALQFGLGLEKFGGKMYVPKIVSLSIIRELGPVFTCLMLAARVGAGITSEIGSMTVTQQVDAMRALGTSPIKKIVIPRVLASLIAFPLLVAFANIDWCAWCLIVWS